MATADPDEHRRDVRVPPRRCERLGSRILIRGRRGTPCRGLVVFASPVVAALALLVPGVTPATAACGGVRHTVPTRHSDPAHRPPLAIGDSTMLLAVKALARVGFEANARGCRPMSEGLALLERLRRERRLPKVVLVNLGANSGMHTAEIQRGLRILGPRRILVLVTSRSRDAGVVRAAGRRWPRRVRVLDWVREYTGHGAWFSDRGLHLSWVGVAAFVRLCRPFVALNRQR